MSLSADPNVQKLAQYLSTVVLAAQKERDAAAVLSRCREAYRKAQEFKEKKTKSFQRAISTSKEMLATLDRQLQSLASAANAEGADKKRGILQQNIKTEQERLARHEQEQSKWLEATMVSEPVVKRLEDANRNHGFCETTRQNAIKSMVEFVQSVSSVVSELNTPTNQNPHTVELRLVIDQIQTQVTQWDKPITESPLISQGILLQSRVQQLLVA